MPPRNGGGELWSRSTKDAGAAAFSGLAVNIAGLYRFVAQIPVGIRPGANLAPVPGPELLVVPGVPHRVAFGQHPGGLLFSGSPFGEQPIVRIVDAFGNWIGTLPSWSLPPSVARPHRRHRPR